MKILLVHNRYQLYGGEDATFESEKKLLESNGHDVHSLVFDNKEIAGRKEKIKLVYQLIYNRKSAGLMNQAIQEFKPEVIHVHNFFYVASPSIFFAARQNSIPVVVTLHNYRLICAGALLMRDSSPCELCVQQVFPTHGVRYKCHRNSSLQSAHLIFATGTHKLLDTWNTKVSRYIALTEFARQKYIHSSLKLIPQKVVVKPNSVADSETVPVEERENYFLFIGRLSTEKGVDVLLKAFEGLRLPLEIIGDGPLRPLVETSIAVHHHIKYAGYQEKSYVISRLKKCRAMVFPSVWYEGLPTTILEAFSTGTPVIVSDIGNLNEIVTHGYNGIHFKTNDPVDLQKTLQDFHANHSVYKDLYAQAKKSYTAKYTHEINYINLMNIYQAALKDSL